MIWVYAVGYVIGYFVVLPHVFRWLLEDIRVVEVDHVDVIYASTLGAGITLAWPIIVLYRLLVRPLAEQVAERYRRQNAN